MDLAVFGDDDFSKFVGAFLENPEKALSILARRKGVVVAHPGAAFVAAATASPTSAAFAIGTNPVCSPVAGLKTDDVRPLRPETCLPLM